jgi:hypothetical protein
MPAIKYSDIPVSLSVGGTTYRFPASNVSIQYANQLEASRILKSRTNNFGNNFRIGGNLDTKVSVSFAASNKTNYNATNITFGAMTGDTSGVLTIGGRDFSGCYLSSATMTIQPFAPVVCGAEFVVLNTPTGVNFNAGSNFTDDLSGYLCHGHNVVITNGTNLTDSSRDSISYKVTCNRTPAYEIGSINAARMFLDSVEKEMSIRSTNVGKFINYSGYGDVITIDPKNDLGTSVINGGFSMSANSRVVSQNLTAQEGDILAGEVTLREVIL